MNDLVMAGRSRRQLALVITIVSVLLVFLGMRITALAGDFNTPKHRPRATVEDVTKHKQAVDQQIQHDSAIAAIFFPSDTGSVTADDTIECGADCQYCKQQLVSDQPPPRAPPFFPVS